VSLLLFDFAIALRCHFSHCRTTAFLNFILIFLFAPDSVSNSFAHHESDIENNFDPLDHTASDRGPVHDRPVAFCGTDFK
jgi:hypothetical protein